MGSGVGGLLFEGLQKARDSVVVETPYGRSLSSQELKKEVENLALRLTQLGIEPRERVMAIVDKSPDSLILYLSCLFAGVVFVPVNPQMRRKEISHMIFDAEPHLVVCRPELEEEVREILRSRGKVLLKTLDAQGGGSLRDATQEPAASMKHAEVASEDVAVMLYTSGTTGHPKGAMLTHGNLISNAVALADAWGFTCDDVLLHALPLFHVHGLFVATHCALVVGAKMLFLPHFDPNIVLAMLPRATVMMGVPTYYSRLLRRTELSKQRCGRIRLFTSGSAPLSSETFRDFEERTGHRIVERYGMTETLITTTNPLDGDRCPGSVGLPLPSVEMRLGEDDELEVRGPTVFKGYFRQPERTASAFRSDGFFRTGDVARIDDDGYLWLTGRATDVIITGGENVYPREVESAIEEIKGVTEVVVFGLHHSDLGEAVAALVVPATLPLGEDSIREELKSMLVGYKVPKRIFFSEELPRNAMGKVERSELQERYRWACR